MTEHIVLTTDLSTESERAFAPVAALAAKLGAKITLLHVVDDLKVAPHGAPLAPPQSAPDLGPQARAAKERLEALAKTLPAGIDVVIAVETGEDPARVVADFAEQHDATCIAVSSHGRSGLRRMVMGSVAERILRHASRPVLVFPPPAAE